MKGEKAYSSQSDQRSGRDAPNSMKKNLPSSYDPKRVEGKWADDWLQGEFFAAGQDLAKQPYTIVIPPPNVTGNLHIGHALNNTLQDILVRWKRMQGYDVLWLPGMDHAGISTQARVEENLQQQGISRHELGREKFVAQVWAWKEQYAANIAQQWKKMGLSLDYTRQHFTLDEGLSQAVKEVFVRLYEKGLIYRGKYIINWDPVARTALSDIEVIYQEVTGALYHLNYPLKEDAGHIRVATTRPETMLGDTAVAVHPQDQRYQDLIGKTVILPLTGREIPIVADEYVDPSFGSGAVKITPAHDPHDFAIGQRHHLPQIIVIDETGRMNGQAGKYQGMDRFVCRKQLAEDLQRAGVLVKIEEHTHAVGHSERSGAVVEPYLSTQWFVAMKPLAQRAIAVQESGAGVRFVPDRFAKIYLHWIENVRDWCISRQLWWGHRIPAWYCEDCGEMMVARIEPVQCANCQQHKLRQDEDVLDTWFSSVLWPFSTLGWPHEAAADLKRYYPTDVLLTGYDIIYFWVARMIFMALEFTGQKPFHDVLITGLVRDADGRKMSKSLGNGVDPMEVIERYGADAMRFMLATGCTLGNDQRFHWERVESAHHFANKIWNAARFVLLHVEDAPRAGLQQIETFSTADRWILHRLHETIGHVTSLLQRDDFAETGRLLYNFIWDDLCDWYIEWAKLPLYGEDAVDQSLRLLHPLMPYITAEIWQHLPGDGTSIAHASWPVMEQVYQAPQAVEEMSVLIETIRAVRNIRVEMEVAPAHRVELLVRPEQEMLTVFQKNKAAICRLCGIGKLIIASDLQRPTQSMTAVVTGAELFLPLVCLMDREKTLARLEAELKKLNAEVDRVEQKLANPGFIAKAPAHVIEDERRKGEVYQEKRAKVQARLREMQQILATKDGQG
jgi:valyl-tRNA synthetase